MAAIGLNDGDFFVKYAVGVILARQLPIASEPAFIGAISLSYGALSGLFLARALVVWRAARHSSNAMSNTALHADAPVISTLGRSIAHMPTSFSKDNAGVIAPAPVLYGIAFAVGFATEKISPTQLLPFPVSAWLGLTFIAVAILIVVSAFKALAQAHTAFDARMSTTQIVTTGAFRFSRNPTYLSLTLLLIGIALAISSLWVLVSVIPAVAATQWGVILREERYLKAKFGEGYSSYASQVRRWL